MDAVISHLEDVNSTLKSLGSAGAELEPYIGSVELLILGTESHPCCVYRKPSCFDVTRQVLQCCWIFAMPVCWTGLASKHAGEAEE